MGPKWIADRRRGFTELLGEKFIPVWHRELGFGELRRLADEYQRVGISEDDRKTVPSLASQVNSLARGTQFHPIASAKARRPRSVRFSTAATGSWLSPNRHGETNIWDGSRLHR